MENRHLIAKQVFELRVGFDETAVPRLQDAFSRHYWQSVVPAFERLFDRLVPADEMVRVDRLELDVGRWSAEEILSGRFIEDLVSRLESVISSALRGGAAEVDIQPLRIGRFDLWLHFLEYGSLPADAARPASQEEWNRQIIECLASENAAVQRLRKLVSRRTVALERLILQYDEAFLLQVLEGLAGREQGDLPRLVSDVVSVVVRALKDLSKRIRSVSERTPAAVESMAAALFDLFAHLLDLDADGHREADLRRRILQALDREAVNPSALAQWLIEADSWRTVLRGFETPELVQELSTGIAAALKDSGGLRSLAGESAPGTTLPAGDLSRRVELAVWRILFEEVIVKGRQSNTSTLITRVIRSDALLPWQGVLIKALDERQDRDKEDKAWARVAEAIEALPSAALERLAELGHSREAEAARVVFPKDVGEELELPRAEAGDVFYVQAAGIILFHPFLNRFFQKLNLCEAGTFIDERSRQRAVCLMHHLATGEVRTPEYQLVLPKFLCGMPFNAPLDHLIEIGSAERSESENLLRTAIERWGVLGNSSPDWLREMFLQRDGKLERRENGWYLAVERKAQDILLDRLPQGWGLGMVKLPWMDELLRIDW